MNSKLIAIILASTVLTPVVFAENAPSYTFVEVGYISYDESDFETSGFKLKGSFEFNDYFFGLVDYGKTSGDIAGFDIDFLTLGYGIGAKFDFNNGSSLFASYTLNN